MTTDFFSNPLSNVTILSDPHSITPPLNKLVLVVVHGVQGAASIKAPYPRVCPQKVFFI